MQQPSKSIFIILFVAVFVLPTFVFASETDGTIDTTNKYAWSENIGWINFGCDNCNVHITDTGMTGHAWSANYGWIILNPSTSGVLNNNEGTLSGSAWGENTGWINFSGVTIDSSGYFNGYASGTTTGQISFNCANTSSCGSSDFKVRTDWRPQSARICVSWTYSDWGSCSNSQQTRTIVSSSPSGCSGGSPVLSQSCFSGGGGIPLGFFDSPSAPAEGFKVAINNNAGITKSSIVNLSFNVGSNVEKIAISNNSDLAGASREKYQPTKEWNLCEGSVCSEGKHNVYVKFYTQYGQSSEVVSGSIVYKKGVEETVLSNNSFVFTKSFKLGDTGNDIKKLQQFLNQNGFVVALNGPGSLGNETMYFGLLTKVALIKFQEAYSADILTPVNLTKGTGFFGPSTIKFINSFNGKSPTQPEESTNQPTSNATSNTISALFTYGLEFGMKNEEVKRLQQLLATLPDIYPEGLTTGYFGTLTEKAVQRFQLKYEVVSSSDDVGFGYVGPKTCAKLGEVFGG